MITVIENRTKFLNGSKKSVVKKRRLSQQLGTLLNYLFNAVQYNAVQYNTMQHLTVQSVELWRIREGVEI